MKPSKIKIRVPDPLAARLRNLHPEIRLKVRSALDEILCDPEVAKALREELFGLRSFRIGKYRVIYRIDGEEVQLVNFGPRSTIYEETLRWLESNQNDGI